MLIAVPRDAYLNPMLDQIAAGLAGRGHELVRTEVQPTGWGGLLDEIDLAVLTPRLDFPPALMAAPRLRGLVFPTIGVDPLDVEAATAAGLLVGNGATDASMVSMAEATVLLIVALQMHLDAKVRMLRDGWRKGVLLGRTLHGKTVGFVGFGRIGQATAARLAGWGVRLIYADPYVEMPEAGAERIPLARLLERADVVSVHVTLTPQTAGMIGAAELALMKPTAVVVNTARGGAIDETALVEALRAGRIAGAALDAFAEEPLAVDHPLRDFDNVLLTPHNVGHTEEMVASFVTAAIENADRIVSGAPPLHCKNPEAVAAWRARLARLPARGPRDERGGNGPGDRPH